MKDLISMKTNAARILVASAAVAALSALSFTATAQDKPSGSATASETRTATVTNIDAKDRWVTLTMADGKTIDVQAGPAVKNFAQIKKGDKVHMKVEDTLSIEVVPAGQAAPNVTGGSATVSAPLGAKPMGIVVDTTVVSGTVTAIDYDKRTVTVQGPAGNPHTMEVGPGAKKFKSVKKGDVVVLTLKTATSIEVVARGK